MAADIQITDARVEGGDNIVVTVRTDVDNPSTVELVWLSTADSAIDIPTSRQGFSVGAGTETREVTLETFVPGGKTAEVNVTANITGPEQDTTTRTVQVQGGVNGGGGADILPFVVAGGGALALAWWVSNQ